MSPVLAPKIVSHTVGLGLTAFWNRLDRNIAPLGRYLSELLELIGGADELTAD